MRSRRKSIIWNHFQVTEARKRAMCFYCSHILSFSAGSIGNLSRHLKTRHPTVAIRSNGRVVSEDVPDQTQIEIKLEAIPEKSTDFTSVPNSKRKKTEETLCLTQNSRYIKFSKEIAPSKSNEIDEQLIKMIVKQYQPFSLVESEEFKTFVSMLNPSYKLPSKKTISTSISPEMYVKTEEKVSETLQNVNATCLTTDCWTSINNQHFLTLTSHFIDSESKLGSVLLGTVEFDEQQTANNLAILLQGVAGKWGLEDKISACISKNGNDLVASAIRACNWPQLSCFAHSLNPIVQKAINQDAVAPIISKIRSIVEHFKHNPLSQAKLFAAQAEMGLVQWKLKRDTPSRWNSTLEMLSRCLEAKDAIVDSITLSNVNLLNINQFEWEIVEKFIEILKIFQLVAREISSEEAVSRSKVIVFVKAINKHMLSLSLRPSSEIPTDLQSIVSSIREDMDEYFKDVEGDELSAQCTILDPRFKKLGFEDENKFKVAVEGIKLKVSTIAGNIEEPADVTETSCPSYSSSLLWEEFDSEAVKYTAENGRVAAAIAEVDKYLQEPLLARTEHPLHWWQDRQKMYPCLFLLAMESLCILGTSVPGKNIFSKSGGIMTERRNSLNTEKIPQIIFLNYNL